MDIKKDWPLYKVTTQRVAGEKIVVRKMKAPDLRQLEEFARRVLCVADCTKLSIYEVTEDCVDMATGELCQRWHVGDPNKQWPRYSTIEHDPNIYAPQAITNLPRAEEEPPDHIAGEARPIYMPGVQNRTILNDAQRTERLNDVRTIAAQVAAKREERRKQYSELARPMRRLTKKVA